MIFGLFTRPLSRKIAAFEGQGEHQAETRILCDPLIYIYIYPSEMREGSLTTGLRGTSLVEQVHFIFVGGILAFLI